MKENLRIINKKELEKKNGKTVQFMKENIKIELKVVKVNLYGIAVLFKKVNLIIIK